MVIFQVCQFAAQYGGNFIKSLTNLEDLLDKEGHSVIYVFIKSAQGSKWIDFFKKNRQVYFVDDKVTSNSVEEELSKLIKLHEPSIIHSHFDGFDIPIVKANNIGARVIWHLHNPLSGVTNLIFSVS